METLINDYSSYIERKKEELKLFGINDILCKNDKISCIKHIMDSKLKYQAKLKTYFLEKTYDCQNTSRNNQEIVFDNLECNYIYQRYDINIKQKNFLNIFYGMDYEDYDYVFTNCGMSAIFAVLYSLNKLIYTVENKGNIYVETERLMDNYINCKNNDKKALFLDTVCFDSLLSKVDYIDLQKYELFIIDTTLYLNEDIKKIVERIKLLNKPIILLKSHTKLDMLGCEWSKLGSVCILKNGHDVDFILKEIKIILSFIGGYAYCEDIPLYYSNKDYSKITNRRNEIIKMNVEYFYDRLKNSNKFEIIKPYHSLFLILKPKKFIYYKKLEEDLHAFANNSKLKGLICYADSFGLDCFGINGYYVNMSAETEVIRISPSDYPQEICSQIYDELIEWLDNYLG